jgi:putative tryptophan/tyrosine transport system substrate-binding protein
MRKTFSMLLLLFALALVQLSSSLCQAAEVQVVADLKLRPVVEIVSGINKTLKAPLKSYFPSQVKGNLESVVVEEQAKVVVALGKEALLEALRLPPSVLVIYDLVVLPPVITRPNTTGFYMATPAREYADFVSNHLRDFSQIAVVGSRDQLNILARGESEHLVHYSVKNTFEFVNTLRQLSSADAILLLPDVSVLTATAMEEAYLLSFRKKIPLFGISEKNVKEGALLALVVDPVNVGKLIGEYATKALKGANIGQLPPSPPRKFELFVNLDTARKMGIRLPEEMVRSAKRTYP